MADNILESYLVKITAATDIGSFLKMGDIVKSAGTNISNFSLKAIKDVAAFEFATVAAFGAIGIGLISLADKTAMTDQSYRLFGLRMLMNKSSARAMQMALDELGATIDEVAYDPELNKRFQYLYEQNIKLGKLLGGNFDDNMRKIRDLRMEYKMFTTEFEFMMMDVVSTLFDKLGFSSGDLFTKLQDLNQWFMDNIPNWSNQISDYLIPAWNDMKVVVKESGRDLKGAADAFSNMIGVISGDESIDKETSSIKKFGDALQDLIKDITVTFLNISLLGKGFGHFGMGIADMAYGFYQAARGKNPEESLNFGRKNFSALAADAKDWWSYFTGQGFNDKNPDMAGFKDFLLTMSGGGGTGATTDKGAMGSFIQQMATKYNIDPNLLYAMMRQEDPSGNPFALSNKGAMGRMQLMPGTAKEYGVTNPYDEKQNIEGGAHYMSDLLKKYNGNVGLALAAYNAGPGAVSSYGGVPPYKETQDYVSRILKDYQSRSEAASNISSVHIDRVDITVPPSTPTSELPRIIKESMQDTIRTKNRKVMAQTGGGPYF